MRHVRRLCLIVTFAILIVNPSVLLADECCQPFEQHCESFCEDHGGVMITNCSGWQCTDSCFCWDINPATGQHYSDIHEEWCEGSCI